jgi:hypothetical protein
VLTRLDVEAQTVATHADLTSKQDVTPEDRPQITAGRVVDHAEAEVEVDVAAEPWLNVKEAGVA